MHRTAVIQHGNYAEALQIVREGVPEPYFGMVSSVEMIERLCADDPHLIVSLNAPADVVQRPNGRLVGVPRPPRSKFLPRRFATRKWARQIRAALKEFGPTRVLFRGDDFALNCGLLAWCVSQGVDTMVAMASFMPQPTGTWEGHVQRRLVGLLNHPSVRLVGNHRWPATRSLVEHGVLEDKAVAYDFTDGNPPPRPEDSPVKRAPAGPWRLIYVGAVVTDKGVEDLVEATRCLAAAGRDLSLTVVGDGAGMDAARRRASSLPEGRVRFLGRIGHPQALGALRESHLAIVPSRHRFREGMPMTLTEALVSRTPAVVSDHPVFRAAFEDEQGVLFAKASDPASLAATIGRVMDSPTLYAKLSESTGQAYARVACETTLPDLVQGWSEADS